jgi:hypothetical protein
MDNIPKKLLRVTCASFWQVACLSLHALWQVALVVLDRLGTESWYDKANLKKSIGDLGSRTAYLRHWWTYSADERQIELGSCSLTCWPSLAEMDYVWHHSCLTIESWLNKALYFLNRSVCFVGGVILFLFLISTYLSLLQISWSLDQMNKIRWFRQWSIWLPFRVPLLPDVCSQEVINDFCKTAKVYHLFH